MTATQPFFSRRLREDPYTVYEQLRAEPGLHRSPVGPWVAGRSEDVRAILTCPAASSRVWALAAEDGPDARRALFAPPRVDDVRGRVAQRMQAWLPFTDAPRQTLLRRALSAPLRVQMAERVRPSIERWVADIVDALPARSPIDLVGAFARAVPQQLTSKLLDLDPVDAERVATWSMEAGRALSPFLGRSDLARIETSLELLDRFVDDLITARRARPGDDLVSDLVRAQSAHGLDDDDLHGLVLFTLAASQETTQAVLAASVLLLAEQPGLLDEVRATDGWRAAANEAMRLQSPVQMTMRRVTEPTTIAGTDLPEGAHVLIVLGSANRDEQAFSEPTHARLDRPDDRHLAFGAGPHTCPGASLAQLEIEVALRALHGRFDRAELVGEPLWETSLTLRSLRRLPVSLVP